MTSAAQASGRRRTGQINSPNKIAAFRVGRFGGGPDPGAARRLPPATLGQAFSLQPHPRILSRTRAQAPR